MTILESVLPARFYLSLVLAGTATAVSAQQPAAAPSLLFDGVTVVDVEHGKLVSDQRIVIAGNRIQAVGPARAVRVPAGGQVIDARGKYMIPGLWEMHTHLVQESTLPIFLLNGVTGVREAAGGLDSGQQRRRQEILAGTRVGPPRQLYASNFIGGTDSIEVRQSVDSAQMSGYDMIKTSGDVRGTYFILAAEARRVGIRFGGHLEEEAGLSALEASDSGASLIDHVWLSGGLDRLCVRNAHPKHQTATLATCQQAAERLRRNGTWWVVTLNEGLAPIRRKLLPPSARSLRIQAAVRSRYQCNQPGNWIRDSARFDAPGSAPADSSGILSLAYRADMPMLAGTDGLPFEIHAELAYLVAEGLTPLAALQAATLNPAMFLHATDSLGTVAPGKLADLVLLDANPLIDITNTTTIRAVVANGRYYDRAALDQLAMAAPSWPCPRP